MPFEALLIPDNLTDSDSDGIDGGTGCNLIFLNCILGISRDRVIPHQLNLSTYHPWFIRSSFKVYIRDGFSIVVERHCIMTYWAIIFI